MFFSSTIDKIWENRFNGLVLAMVVALAQAQCDIQNEVSIRTTNLYANIMGKFQKFSVRMRSKRLRMF